MTRTDHEPLVPLPGQLVFPFMAEPSPTGCLSLGQTNSLTGRAKEAQPGKHPARETTSGKGETRNG